MVVTILTIALGTAGIAFRTSADKIDRYYKEATAGNAKNYASMVDGDYVLELRKCVESEEFQKTRDRAEAEDNEELVLEYLKKKGLLEEYDRIRAELTNYVNNIDGIEYLYLIAVGDADAKYDMYLIDDLNNPAYETGYYEEREAELQGMDFSVGIEPTISNGDWGWLCSAFCPVFASDGTFVCVVGCDFGMEEVMAERSRLMFYLIVGALIMTVIILSGSMVFINKVVVEPLDSMTKELKNFKPSKHASYHDAGVMELDIRSNDEISEIYQGIRSMQTNIVDYLKDMSILEQGKKKAESDIREKEMQIGQLSIETYKDSLTGVGNKASYEKHVDTLNQQLAEESMAFAIAMIDMNNLKQVNDLHGHEAGDRYIKGCCHMVCEAFKHSPVFRIGGDEFAVLLQGSDYARREEIVTELRKAFEDTFSRTDVDPWLRYSAAVGMAEKLREDKTVEAVFKRADKAMYEDKKAFKERHGLTR